MVGTWKGLPVKVFQILTGTGHWLCQISRRDGVDARSALHVAAAKRHFDLVFFSFILRHMASENGFTRLQQRIYFQIFAWLFCTLRLDSMTVQE